MSLRARPAKIRDWGERSAATPPAPSARRRPTGTPATPQISLCDTCRASRPNTRAAARRRQAQIHLCYTTRRRRPNLFLCNAPLTHDDQKHAAHTKTLPLLSAARSLLQQQSTTSRINTAQNLIQANILKAVRGSVSVGSATSSNGDLAAVTNARSIPQYYYLTNAADAYWSGDAVTTTKGVQDPGSTRAP